MQAKNLVLSEEQFDKFQKYCKEKGFDLSYFSDLGSMGMKELENYQLEKAPRVAKLQKRRFGSKCKIYDVAEWERKDWSNTFPVLYEEFEKYVR